MKSSLTKESEMKEIIAILRKPLNKRTEQDLDMIIPYMQQVQFF